MSARKGRPPLRREGGKAPQVSVSLDRATEAALERLTRERGLSPGAAVRELLTAWGVSPRVREAVAELRPREVRS